MCDIGARAARDFSVGTGSGGSRRAERIQMIEQFLSHEYRLYQLLID